ncbi:MAG: ATP-binding protein [Phaeodactylibacter sp.]|nr:ATP-binding protein [Phaeodactylibacter sp.]
MPLNSPFKFLDAYGKEDKDIFFGRDDEVEQLYELVFQSNLTLVYGQSGTGKTSLVQCGLANRFAQSDWFNVYIRRNEDINQSMLAILQNYQVKKPESSSLKERLLRRRQGAERKTAGSREEEVKDELIRTLRALYNYYLKPVYLIFDQFEELFILGNRPEQEKFYRSIANILASEPYCRVILIMREESIAQLYDFEKVVPRLFDKRLRVEPMSRLKTAEVIGRTTEKFSIRLADESVPERIIDVLSEGQGRVELTYLQVFLDKLFQEAAKTSPDGVVFSGPLIQKAGSIDDILADFLDRQMESIQMELQQSFPAVSPSAVKKVAGSFVTLEGTKRPLSKEQAAVGNVTEEQGGFVVGQLEKARILRFENNRYELAHDTLARHIAGGRTADEVALLQVAKLARDRLNVYETAKTYLNNNELQLINSFKSRLRDENSLSAEEWAFVRKSERANRARRRAVAGLTLALIAVLAGFSVFSWAQWQKAQVSARVAKAKEAEAQKALEGLKEEQAQRALAKYNEYLARGKASMNQTYYAQAIQEFDLALEALQDTEPVAGFDEKGGEARQLKEVAQSKSGVSQRFAQLIQDGESDEGRGNRWLVDAKRKYQEALELGYDNNTAQSRITALEGKLENAFDTFVSEGETFFRTNNASGFRRALDSYQQANRIRSTRDIRERIQACKDSLGLTN